MPRTYDLRWDPDARKYTPVDITAVLKHREQGAFVEVDAEDVTFQPEQPDVLTLQVRREPKAMVASVTVSESALRRTDFDDLIRKPVPVKVVAKTPPGANGTPGRDVVQSCQVRIHPVPCTVKLLRPTPQELPWPARSERPVELELQILRHGDQPLANATVDLKRRVGPKPKEGTFEPGGGPPRVTDDQGRVTFCYQPPDLWYRPGGEYLEEFTVLIGEAREEAGRVRLPLAPRLKATLRVEKSKPIEETDFGVQLEPKELELELGPSLQPDAIRIAPLLQGNVAGHELKLPLAYARIKIDVHDEESTTPAFAEGSEPVTDIAGEALWRLPELARAFPAPRTCVLSEDENPKGGLNPETERIIHFCEDKIAKYLPVSLLDPTLAQGLQEYRRDFLGHVALRDLPLLDKAWSAAELLTAGATHTKLFNDLYNRQWGMMGDVLGNVMSDLLALAVNVIGVGDKCIEEWAPRAATYFRSWVQYLSELPWLNRLIGYLRGRLASGLSTCRGLLQDLVEFIGRHLPGTWDSIATRARTLLAQLGKDIDELVGLTLPGSTSTVGEVAEAMQEWLYRALRLVLGAVGRVLLVIGDCIKGIVSFLVEKIGKFLAASYEVLAPLAEQYVTPAMRAVSEYVRTNVHRSLTSEDSGYIALSLAKLIETLISWANEKLQATESAGSAAGSKWVGSLVIMDLLSDPVLNGLLKRARALEVPQRHQERLEQFRDWCTSCRESVGRGEKDMATIDEWMSHVDNLILCCELIVMLVVTLFSLGGTVLIGQAFTALEIAIGSFKLALVRLPQGLAVMVAGFAMALYYALGTAALPLADA